jgi:hypothetical protein
MEATPVKLVGILSTAVLFLALGAAVPVYAQQEQQHDQKQEEKAKPARQDQKQTQQHKPAMQEKKAAPRQEKAAKQEKPSPQQEKNGKQQRTAQQQRHTGQAKPSEQAKRGGAGRIPEARYRANFGQEHRFHVSQSDYRGHRFQYGGYSFGFVDPWPANWLYTQDVYVVEINGMYFLCNPMYPGVNLALSITL